MQHPHLSLTQTHKLTSLTPPHTHTHRSMARDHKSSLGLVDGGKLVANLSVSDLRCTWLPHLASSRQYQALSQPLLSVHELPHLAPSQQ